MTTINNDFALGTKAAKALNLEDFAGDKLELIQYIESIDKDGFNVDVSIREGDTTGTFTLSREDAENLLGALASILINTPAQV